MITGGAKFLEQNSALATAGTTITDLYNNASADYAIDKNPITFYRTNGSSDARSEVLTVTFGSSVSMNRVAFLDINWKNFSAKYFSSGSWANFTGVVAADGAKATLSETAFAKDTGYYEVDLVVTTGLQITVNTTQTANQEKYCAQIIGTKELGTMKGFPQIAQVNADRNLRISKTLSGRNVVQKSNELFNFA